MPVTVFRSDPRRREKPCLRCGLSLRKLFDQTHCPGCGLSIWLSLNNNDVLDASSPPWLNILSLGSWIMAAAQVAGLIAYLLYMFAADPGPLGVAAATVYLLAYHIGLLLAARHERRWPDHIRLLRISARVVAVAGVALGVLFPFSPALQAAGPARRTSVQYSPPTAAASTDPDDIPYDSPDDQTVSPIPGFSAHSILLELFIAAGAMITFAYFRQLARRVPNHRVARICGIILFAPLISLLKTAPCIGLMVGIGIWRFVDYLGFIYLPLSMALFIWFARTFRAASRTAVQRWAAETVPPAAGA